MKTANKLILGTVLLTFAGMASAQRPGPGGPPKEAVEACSGKAVAASCTMTTPRGDEVSGQCIETPDDQMACLPEGHDPKSGGRPPKEGE